MEALEVFPCEKCGKTFDYVYALKRHGKSCGANKPRKCKKCLKWFENHLFATRHELRCFNDNTPLVCSFCSKKFDHLYMLQRHYRATHRIKMSKLNKKSQLDSSTHIESNFQANEDRLQDAPQQREKIDTEKSPSVYTIEIESITDTPDDDPSVQTLVYKIRQTTDSAEIEVLPECVISDFDSVLHENDASTEVSKSESCEKNVEVDDAEYLEAAEYYGIE